MLVTNTRGKQRGSARRAGFIALLFAAVAAFAPPASLATSKPDLDAQLARLMAWWPGDYDNNEQIVRQSGGGLAVPTSSPIYRLHSVFRKAAVPALGANVLYLEEYRDNDPQKFVRVRLYTLSIDTAAGAIRVKLHTPVGKDFEAAAAIGSAMPIAAVERLGPGDVRSARDSCDLLLRFVGGQFEGGMPPKGCDFERRDWFEYQLVVGPRYHWVRDRRRAYANDAVTWEMAPGSNYEWFQQTKARWFRCVVNHNAAGDMTQTARLTEVDLHDQGGEADIAWPDGRTLSFVIHTRAFTSPTDREFPLFRIHEKGKPVPIAYAYASDEAERFGLNLGWFYTLCRLRD